MIDRYKIVSINGQERLILFLNLNYEFGGNKNKRKSLKKMILEYISKNRINFHEGIITFVVGGVMIGNVIFNNNQFKDYKPIDNYVSNSVVFQADSVMGDIITLEGEHEVVKETTLGKEKNSIRNEAKIGKKEEVKVTTAMEGIKEEVKKEEEIIDNKTYINLKKNDGSIIKVELEEYVIGVVGAEMPALFNIEALKAQAIIARTYALKANVNGKVLKDNESNQSYKTNEELKKLWSDNYGTYYSKIKSAVDETRGMVLTYNGNYIEAVYHSTSNGMTESSVNVWGNYYPYLISVSSQYDSLNVSYIKNTEINYQELSNKLGIDINKDTHIELIGKTSGNRVESVKIGEQMYKGIDFRNILGLRSADFKIEYTDNGIVFTTRGYGHGVGLSQYGANGMAKNGYSYEAILKHYYPGVNLKKN